MNLFVKPMAACALPGQPTGDPAARRFPPERRDLGQAWATCWRQASLAAALLDLSGCAGLRPAGALPVPKARLLRGLSARARGVKVEASRARAVSVAPKLTDVTQNVPWEEHAFWAPPNARSS